MDFEGRRVILETQNRPQEAPREKTTKSSEKIEREESRRRTTRASQRSPRWFFGPREAPNSPPRAPQRSPGAPQETHKSAKKKPTKAPRRSADHLRIEDVDFSKIELPPRRELDFRGSEGHLGDPKSTRRGSER